MIDAEQLGEVPPHPHSIPRPNAMVLAVGPTEEDRNGRILFLSVILAGEL